MPQSHVTPSSGRTDIDLSPEIRVPRTMLTDGARVQQVARGGPAGLAGIEGDIITRISNYAVDRQTPLPNALQAYSPGRLPLRLSSTAMAG